MHSCEQTVAIRTLRKTSRKAQLEFFKLKTEHVMRVFKQEQMYMVEEYFLLKQKDSKNQIKMNKNSRMIQQQERIINDMQVFYHDCLDIIFRKVEQKQTRIQNCLKLAGDNAAESCNDPFKLYCGYIDILKPIEYENDLTEYIDKIN